MHGFDGFSNRKYQPDFVYHKEGKTYAVKVELIPKSIKRFEANIKSNYMAYDFQLWVAPSREHKVRQMLEHFRIMYPGIEVVSLEEVEKHLRRHN